MAAINAIEARDQLGDLLNRVAYGKERITIGKRGKAMAVLVPLEDLEALQKLEDKIDLREAHAALAEIKRGEYHILAEVEAELNIDKD